MFGFRVPDVDEVMLISGGKTKDNKQFAIHRSSKFILWGLPRKVAFLSLAQRKANISEDCNDTNGLPIHLEATVAFKIGRDDDSIYAAGERFRDDQKRDTDMAGQTGNIFGGHLRSIAGSMSFDSIMRNRQELAENVLGASKEEVANMGLIVDSFVINRLIGPEDYVDALSAPQRAAVEQAASIARSQAAQKAAEIEQESQRKQAEYTRQTLVTKAQLQAEVDKENETAKQSGPLAAANAQKAVLAAQTELATGQATLREAELRATQIKVAEANAAQLKIDAEAAASQAKTAADAKAHATMVQADADAHKMSVQAEAMAANDRVNLDQMLIQALPQLVEAASKTLTGANVTIFDGVEGANRTIAAAVTQGLSMFNTVRDQLTKATDQVEIREIEKLANSGGQN